MKIVIAWREGERTIFSFRDYDLLSMLGYFILNSNLSAQNWLQNNYYPG